MTDLKSVEYGDNHLSIREWSVSDRPREKYLAMGSGSLSDAELLAILLRCGSQKESALDLARKILASCGNSLKKLSKLSIEELTYINGIGNAKAITLHSAFELGRRWQVEPITLQHKIGSSQDLIDLMLSKISDIHHEEFWAIFVNQAMAILKEQRIAQGGLTQTTVDVRLIAKTAIDVHATGVFIAHNHPSGNLEPSDEDIRLTQHIRQAVALFNIKLYDHVIVGGNRGYSFFAEGLL